jgi:hemerythrin-like domain-containing protein
MVYPLNRIGNSSGAAANAAANPDDPLKHLVACHDRIEERLQILERAVPHLRSDSEAKRQEAREALDKALQFLQTMGHLHTQDEEESVFPRLRASVRDDPDSLGELSSLLESQHRDKEEVLEKLLAELQAFPSHPEPPSAEQASRVEGLIGELAGLYRPHIMIENQRLIPLAAEYLKKSDLELIRQEMRSRRGL